jgi:hypothetical protein
MLRTLSDRTTIAPRQCCYSRQVVHVHDHTLILPYVLESELAAIVFALDNANLAEGAFAYYS